MYVSRYGSRLSINGKGGRMKMLIIFFMYNPFILLMYFPAKGGGGTLTPIFKPEGNHQYYEVCLVSSLTLHANYIYYQRCIHWFIRPMKLRTPVANTGKLRFIGQMHVLLSRYVMDELNEKLIDVNQVWRAICDLYISEQIILSLKKSLHNILYIYWQF